LGALGFKTTEINMNKKTKNLVKKALKNGFKAKPPKGMKYLKDVPVGKMFITNSGMRGVLIDIGVNAKVVILDVKVSDDDKQYYLGKQTISATTEVYK